MEIKINQPGGGGCIMLCAGGLVAIFPAKIDICVAINYTFVRKKMFALASSLFSILLCF